MPSEPDSLTFAEATKVTPLSPTTFSVDLPQNWSIGTVPHGGYVTALFLTVARTYFNTTLSKQNQPHTIALHLSFLRRTSQGPALFIIKPLKVGRQTTVISITLSQHDVEEVVCTLTQSNIFSETGVTYDTQWELEPAPKPVDLKKLSENGEDENWRVQRETEMAYRGFRKATENCEFAFPKQGQRRQGTADEWVRLKSGERWTDAAVGYLADTWPMPVESFLHPPNSSSSSSPKLSSSPSSSSKGPTTHAGPGTFWYPTLVLNLDVKKALPTPGPEWLFARASTKSIKNGRMDVDVVIQDELGEVVALSHHVALAVPVARNTAERKTKVVKSNI